MATKTKLARLISKTRKQQKFGLREFADLVPISPSYLCKWETGALSKDPSDEKIKKMGEILGIKKSKVYSLSTTDGTLMLKEAFSCNSKSEKKIRDFLDQVGKKKVSSSVWDKILKLVK